MHCIHGRWNSKSLPLKTYVLLPEAMAAITKSSAALLAAETTHGIGGRTRRSIDSAPIRGTEQPSKLLGLLVGFFACSLWQDERYGSRGDLTHQISQRTTWNVNDLVGVTYNSGGALSAKDNNDFNLCVALILFATVREACKHMPSKDSPK